MKAKVLIVLSSIFIIAAISVQAQSDSIQKDTVIKKKYQAKAPPTKHFGAEAFKPSNTITIRWLGMAGFLVNSLGTTFMIDPLLEGYDMPLLMDFPITLKEVPHVDAIFATPIDNDNYSVETFNDLKHVTKA